jgi:hypothetical protein
MNRFLYFSSLLMMMGCGEEKISSDTGVEEDSATEEDTNTSPEDTSPPAHTLSMTGSVKYADGTVVERSSVRVQMCYASSCYPGQLGENGAFTFPSLAVGTYSFNAIPLGGDFNTYATPIDFFELTEDMDTFVVGNTVTIPSFGETVSPTTGDYDVGDGLIININSDTYVPHSGDEDQEQFVGAVAIEPQEFGLPMSMMDGEAHRIWYLGAYEAHTAPGWGFHLTDVGLEAGTEVLIYNANYGEKIWELTETVTVAENGSLTSEHGIQILSLLVLATSPN